MGRLRRIRVVRKEEGVLDVKGMDICVKLAAAKASPSVVGILSRHLPADMAEFRFRNQVSTLSEYEAKERGEIVFWGSAIIIECHPSEETSVLNNNNFISTIICAATLLHRTNGVQPSDVQVDVYLWDGNICHGRVVACDFHYNLAAIHIQTESPLQVAILRKLDVVAHNLTPIHQPVLRPHSSKFKISPGTRLITLSRSFRPLNAHIVGSGVFRATTHNRKLNFNELFWVKDSNHPEKKGGAVINYLGEVIGLMFYDSPFLPINLVSTWWKHFKNYRQYYRPCLGVQIANLHSSCSDYLREFMAVFPDVIGGVVVTKVAEDSPAYCSGIRPEDVIVKCDGKLICSSLELFEMVWNKVGMEFVELVVLRARSGETLNLKLKVEPTSPDKIYRWERTLWNVFHPAEQTAN